jgi:hypothetical protein
MDIDSLTGDISVTLLNPMELAECARRVDPESTDLVVSDGPALMYPHAESASKRDIALTDRPNSEIAKSSDEIQLYVDHLESDLELTKAALVDSLIFLSMTVAGSRSEIIAPEDISGMRVQLEEDRQRLIAYWQEWLQRDPDDGFAQRMLSMLRATED